MVIFLYFFVYWNMQSVYTVTNIILCYLFLSMCESEYKFNCIQLRPHMMVVLNESVSSPSVAVSWGHGCWTVWSGGSGVLLSVALRPGVPTSFSQSRRCGHPHARSRTERAGRKMCAPSKNIPVAASLLLTTHSLKSPVTWPQLATERSLGDAGIYAGWPCALR